MPERKVKVNMPGLGLVEGSEVPILESTDRWTEVKLEDGTLLRIKVIVMSAVRIDGKYDPTGNPLYALQAQQAMVASAPDHLRQQAVTKDPKVQ